jgi:hypothetical protein
LPRGAGGGNAALEHTAGRGSDQSAEDDRERECLGVGWPGRGRSRESSRRTRPSRKRLRPSSRWMVEGWRPSRAAISPTGRQASMRRNRVRRWRGRAGGALVHGGR